MLAGLLPIAAACSLFAPTGSGGRTDVSFVDVRDSALRSVSACDKYAQDLHSWVGYYWSARAPKARWQSDAVVCTAFWPAHSGVDSTLIVVRSTKPRTDQVARRLCTKLAK